MAKYYSTSENYDAVTLTWDHLQASLHCCGVDNYEDYQKNEAWQRGEKLIPESCCVLDGDPLKLKPLAPTCTRSPNDVNSYYKKVLYTYILIGNRFLLYVLYFLFIYKFLGLLYGCYKLDNVEFKYRNWCSNWFRCYRNCWYHICILFNEIDK